MLEKEHILTFASPHKFFSNAGNQYPDTKNIVSVPSARVQTAIGEHSEHLLERVKRGETCQQLVLSFNTYLSIQRQELSLTEIQDDSRSYPPC